MRYLRQKDVEEEKDRLATVFVRDDVVLPKRRDFDFYPTAEIDVERGLDFLWNTLALEDPKRQPPNSLWAPAVLDPGAGDGVWCRVLSRRCRPRLLVGVEVRNVSRPPEYDRWVVGDFLSDTVPILSPGGYDLAIGNIPYRDAEAFCRRSLEFLKDGGYLLFLLRLTFLESQKRGEVLFVEHPPLRVGVCKRRPSFSGNGKTSPDAYCYCIWRKGWQGEPTLTWV